MVSSYRLMCLYLESRATYLQVQKAKARLLLEQARLDGFAFMDTKAQVKATLAKLNLTLAHIAKVGARLRTRVQGQFN